MNPPRSLYVHIPFCRHICPYCDFPKLLSSTGYQSRYVSALLREDERYSYLHFDTIYLGGGTPSALEPEQLTKIIKTLISRHGAPKELTVECNPEDVDSRMAQLFYSLGVNRVSLGVQSVSDRTLKYLGRRHTAKGAEIALDNLRSAGIDNVSCDFIYGLPGEGRDELLNDLAWVGAHRLTHVSLYALQLEPHTQMYNQGVKEPDQDTLSDDYELINQTLAKSGMRRYEVSNFCLPGYESLHNLCYWKGDAYAAIGYGASSYVDGVREVRTRNMEEYLSGKFVHSAHRESLREQEFDYLMCNLRLDRGFSLEDFESRFGHSFLESYADRIRILGDRLIVEDGRVRVRPDQIYVLDSVLVDLLDFSSLSEEGA